MTEGAGWSRERLDGLPGRTLTLLAEALALAVNDHAVHSRVVAADFVALVVMLRRVWRD